MLRHFNTIFRNLNIAFRHLLAVCLVFTVCQPAWAADTIETWDQGAADFEIYFGTDEIGGPASEHKISSTALMGWGLAERFSAFMSLGTESDSFLNNSEGELDFGFFGTPLDTKNVDLDLGFILKLAGPGLSETTATPFFEINLDSARQENPYGIYLRGMIDISGTYTENQQPIRNVDMNFTLGTFYTLYPGQQLFLEYDATFKDEPDPEESSFENGSLALGYNLMLNETLELITEARLNIPLENEKTSVGFFVGLIATL